MFCFVLRFLLVIYMGSLMVFCFFIVIDAIYIGFQLFPLKSLLFMCSFCFLCVFVLYLPEFYMFFIESVSIYLGFWSSADNLNS